MGLPSIAMEGGGAYNRYGKLPAGGGALALPLLEKAVQKVVVQADSRPVVIADYGSSQGKNSLAPMRIAIRDLRPRIGDARPIFVFHIDQPTNDFNSLVETLSSDADRYLLAEPHVFPCVIGRSFYEQVLPAESVHIGWSSYAAVWLSRIPATIPGHFLSLASTGEVRAEFARQGARDWDSFLALRAAELVAGGRLVVVLPAVPDSGATGFESIMGHANAALEELVEDGEITGEERGRMVLGAYPRRKEELLAPFAGGQYRDLRVEDFAESGLVDSAWTEYEKDGDVQALATKHALFFRSIFMPSLATALDRVRAGEAGAMSAFGDELQARMTRRISERPVALHSFVHTIVLAKR